MSILRLPLLKKNDKVSPLQDPLAPNELGRTSLPVSIYREGISVPQMQDPFALGEGLGPLTWMPRERCCSWDSALERWCWCCWEQLLCVRLSTQS